jgi:hypothetical protein
MKLAGAAFTVISVAALASQAHADSKAWSTGKAVIGANATMVGGISASSVRSSGLYQQMLPLLMSQAGEAKTALDSIQKECNIDMLASIDSLAFGIDDNKAGTIVIALKGTNHKELDACAQKLAKAENKTVAISADGKLTKYAGMGDKAIYLDWLSADVFAVSTAPDDKDATLKILTSGVTSNKALKPALAALDKSASVWFVMNKDQPLPDVGGTMKQLYVTAKVANKKIDIGGHVVTDSAKSATAIATDSAKKLDDARANANATMKSTLATVKITSSGADVVATASVSEDDVLPLLMSVAH